MAILETLEQLNNYKLVETGLGNKSLMHHLFEGSHVILDDSGALLSIMQDKAKLFSRYSSHYKNEKIQQYKKIHENEGHDSEQLQKKAEEYFKQQKPDFSIRAEVIFNEFLIGTIIKEGKTYTWLQFEGHSHQARTTYGNILLRFLDNVLKLVGYSLEKFQHHLDFVTYCWHGKKQNIGQYGNSFFTESSPITMQVNDSDLLTESLAIKA